MEMRPYSGGKFEKIGSEESHTIETFERKIHGTPESEPQRQVSHKQYTERRTYGKDENGDIVVKIETDPKVPVRPVSPVRPVTPVGEHRDNHLLRPIQPLSIPRIDVRGGSPRDSERGGQRERGYVDYDYSPRSVTLDNSQYLGAVSPRSQGAASPRSVSSGGSQAGSAMKKLIKKSRWVSVHDGRPVSPFVETVVYQPGHTYQPERHSSASRRSLFSTGSSPSPTHSPSRAASGMSRRGSGLRRDYQREYSTSECSYYVENPLYQD